VAAERKRLDGVKLTVAGRYTGASSWTAKRGVKNDF